MNNNKGENSSKGEETMLDDYERELQASSDPADQIALRIRLDLKSKGIDPDGDDWYVTDISYNYNKDESIVVKDKPLIFKPVKIT